MENCFENVNMPTCIWFSTDDKRNVYASMLSGFLFFTGWWFLIDATSICGNILPGYHMCGVLGTISLIMVNSVSNAQHRSHDTKSTEILPELESNNFYNDDGFLRRTTYTSGEVYLQGSMGSPQGCFLSYKMQFYELRGDYYEGGCLSSQGTKIWLFLGFLLGFASMIASCGILFKGFTKGCQWSGVAIVLQNALILISSMVYKFVRSEDI